MSPLSVVHLTNAIAPDKLGGLERYVRELAEQLVKDGVEVSILTKRVLPESPRHEVTAEGLSIFRHDAPSKSKRTFALRYPFVVGHGVLRDLRRFPKSTVLNCHYALTTLPLLMTRRRFVYTFHAPVHKEVLMERGGSYSLPTFLQKSAVAAVRLVEKSVLHRASAIVVLSDAMAQEVRELSPSSVGKISKIPGGFDSEFFCPAEKSDHSTPSDSFRLFTARRLTIRTGVVELAEAIALLRSRGDNVTLRIAGDGHQRNEVEQRIQQLDLAEYVTLLGRITDEQVRDEYRQADLVMMPTQHLEGFGLTSAEAMACGTVVAGTPIGANCEVLGQFNARLVSVDASPQAMADKIHELRKNDDFLREMRVTAADYAVRRWSWRAVAKAYEDLYEQ